METDPLVERPPGMRVEPTPGQATDTATSLLDAAAAIIGERGIDRLSTTDVGARAGVSVGTVYRYFEDRDALIRTLYERNVARMRAALVEAAATPHGTLEADVRALLGAYVHMHRCLPAYQAVRTWQWLQPTARASRAKAVEGAAGDLARVLAPRHGVVLTPERVEAIAGAARRADAIVLAAFLDDPGMLDAAAVDALLAAEGMLVAAVLAAIRD